MKRTAPPDWQLPSGVNRGLWDYLHDPGLARHYDAGLINSPLIRLDLDFVRRHCPRPGRLLDLGCGTGRLLLAFARLGYPVLGVDLSLEMLAVASRKAALEGLAVDLLQANLTDLGGLDEACFDHAACLFSTLGMIVGADNRRRVVEHAYRLLRPRGRFILHVHNRWFNLRDRDGRRWLLADLVGVREPGCDRGDRVMPVHQGIAGLTLHLFTRSEAERLLKSVGFRLREALPVGLGSQGRLGWSWLLGRLRAQGYLLAAEKP